MLQINFENGREMLNAITVRGIDLYNVTLGYYVFCYNEHGSVAVYAVGLEVAKKLERRATADNEYWSAYLGKGGIIYDSLEYKARYYGDGNNTFDAALGFCNNYYDQGVWVQTEDLNDVLYV